MDAILQALGAPGIAAAIASGVAAATLAFVGVLLNIFVTLRSNTKTGKRAVATFRQAWIDNLRKTLSEYHSILMSAPPPLSTADDRKVSDLGTQIELMLNPEEDASQKLEEIMEKIYSAPTLEAKIALDPEFVAAARRVLKDEWRRVKAELR
ncbi:hypothetical protein [Bradyrhizobium glycinis]|uniref:hypothetical protein n=1 Tax=Bradyrhizobium glycinis TaxID=2751812 RepID=UPI0018D8FA65|nr:hypothetical protein [Bradyrhizobium glycinis]MBH5373503.1 hypothetical protein [Bradyrhizobium glycinis]